MLRLHQPKMAFQALVRNSCRALTICIPPAAVPLAPDTAIARRPTHEVSGQPASMSSQKSRYTIVIDKLSRWE